MITKEVELLLNIALKEAINRNHEYVLIEHVLYAICCSSYGRKFLDDCGASTKQLIADLDNYLHSSVEKRLDQKKSPLTSVMVERTINRAVKHSLSSDQDACDIPDILVSMMEEKESYSVFLLHQENINRFKIIKQLTKFQRENARQTQQAPEPDKRNEEEKVIELYFSDLLQKAKSGNIDPLIGRRKELDQMVNILARRKKNNVILVGDPGVGKTALVEGMVLRIIDQEIHPYFKKYEIYSLDIGNLLSGTKFRGDFEERVKKIINVFKRKPNSIIFIDEIHMIVGAGSTNGSQMDASNLLKSMLAEGEIRVIGTTTHEEYRQQLQKDHALSRRFEKVVVSETSIDDTTEILYQLKSLYEKYHRVDFPESLLKHFPELSKQYFPEKYLPDGAIDLMDLIGARVKLEPNFKIRNKTKVNLKQVENMIQSISGIPVRTIEKDQRKIFSQLEKNLRKDIFGQDEALDTMIKAIKLAKTGLVEQHKTMGSFLFTGPTGVGKTELCKSICEHLNINLIRLDMSEFLESHSVSKLIGAPPGYVGFNERSGELTEQVKKHPYSLILLDEIEKAHPEVLNVFLQVMDNGSLKDSGGNPVSFEHTLLVMTSNLGADEMSKNQVGFFQTKKAFQERPINNFFSPEFRNRITKIVPFSFLERENIVRIVKKQLGLLNEMLREKNVTIKLSTSALNYLVENGFDQQMGARPIKRIIDLEIKDKLIDELIYGSLQKGGVAQFSTKNNQLFVKCQAI